MKKFDGNDCSPPHLNTVATLPAGVVVWPFTKLF